VAGRGRGLTADRVKKTFGGGRMVTAEDAVRRGMVDRLFPTLDLALNYAPSYASRLALKADLDRMMIASLIWVTTAEQWNVCAHVRQPSTPNEWPVNCGCSQQMRKRSGSRTSITARGGYGSPSAKSATELGPGACAEMNVMERAPGNVCYVALGLSVTRLGNGSRSKCC